MGFVAGPQDVAQKASHKGPEPSPGGLQVQCLLEMPGRRENAGDAGSGDPAYRGTSWASRCAIGVGMAVAGHPSLRTGLADFPHPALQSVSHPLAAGLVRLAKAKAYREISPSFSKNALG